MSNKIIDVSFYNGMVNWKSAKSQGVGGAILKIVNKQMEPDSCFMDNLKGCEKNKILWGVYNYSYATTVKKAESDMNRVCDILDAANVKKYFKLGIWFDLEDKTQSRLSKSVISNILNAAQRVVEARGYVFGVYTGLSFYNEHIDRKSVNCKRWWVARYYKGNTKMSFKEAVDQNYKPLNDIFAWQYTSSGRFSPPICPGNNGSVDLSIVYSDMNEKERSENVGASVLIGHASISERGTTNGVKGDSTGKEVCVRTWYSKPWGYMAVHPDANVRERHAKAIEAACKNNNIGYGQSDRNTLYKLAKATGYDLSKVGKCNCDCSSLQNVAAVASGAKGVTYGSNGWTTSTMLSALKSAGYKVITDSTYLKNAYYCVRGAIYVKAGSHTVAGLTNGSKASQTLAKAGIVSSVTTNASSSSNSTSTKLTVDGVMGKNTTKSAQKIFRTSVDGIISNQLNTCKSICKGITSAEWSDTKKGGSALVKAIQKWVGTTADGYMGSDTIKKLQKKLGTPIDGRLDNPSQCIKAFQEWLNKQ